MKTATKPVKVLVELEVLPLCACGEPDCLMPRCECAEYGLVFEECAPLAGVPSLRSCCCGKVYRLELCDAGDDAAWRKRRGIGADCSSCLGTGIGRTSDHDCPRCHGRGYDKLERDDR